MPSSHVSVRVLAENSFFPGIPLDKGLQSRFCEVNVMNR